MTAPIILLCVLLALGYWLLASHATPLRLAAYAALLISAGAMCVLAFGTPRSSWMLPRAVAGTLRGVVIVEHQAIYVWLTPDGAAAPLSLQLAWSDQQAAALERAQAESRRTGRKAHVRVAGGLTGVGNGLAHGKKGTGGDSLAGAHEDVQIEMAAPAPIEGKDGE
jgi:hypothetical protein